MSESSLEQRPGYKVAANGKDGKPAVFYGSNGWHEQTAAMTREAAEQLIIDLSTRPGIGGVLHYLYKIANATYVKDKKGEVWNNMTGKPVPPTNLPSITRRF